MASEEQIAEHIDEILQDCFMNHPLKDWREHCKNSGIDGAARSIAGFLSLAGQRDSLGGAGMDNEELLERMEEQGGLVINDLLAYLAEPGSSLPGETPAS